MIHLKKVIFLSEDWGAPQCTPVTAYDLLGIGDQYFSIECRRLAADCYRLCLAVESECIRAAHNLVEIYFMDGDSEGAFKLLGNAWLLSPAHLKNHPIVYE